MGMQSAQHPKTAVSGPDRINVEPLRLYALSDFQGPGPPGAF
jgi:hypothetical protein